MTARSAIAFLTVVGRAESPGPGTLDWFPAVGAGLGAVLGGIWWGASQAWPGTVAGAIVVAADLGLTGLLHLDGLVDSADGLLAPMDRNRRLAVMSAPDAGAFGVGTAGAVLLLRWAALASLKADVALVAGLWCLSRTAMAAVVRTRSYARAEGGLPSLFSGPTRWPVLIAGIGAGAGLCALWRIPAGPVAAAAGLAGFAAVLALAERRVGGYTGDVLGAAAMVGETVGLVVAAARW